MILLADKVPNNQEAFTTEVVNISQRLGVDPNALMVLMYFESKLRPTAVNALSGATGLIQFMPSTATSLGTTTAELKSMNNLEQLVYVEKYLKKRIKQHGQPKDLGELYLLIFYPLAVRKSDSFILGSQVSEARVKLIAKQNKGLANGKDYITKQDVTAYINNYAATHGYIETTTATGGFSGGSLFNFDVDKRLYIAALAGIVILLLILLYIYR